MTVSDVTDLAREVRSHEVHVIREILPCSGHAGNLRLASELTLCADLKRYRAYLAGEGILKYTQTINRE